MNDAWAKKTLSRTYAPPPDVDCVDNSVKLLVQQMPASAYRIRPNRSCDVLFEATDGTYGQGLADRQGAERQHDHTRCARSS